MSLIELGSVTIAAFAAYLKADEQSKPTIQGMFYLFVALEAGLSVSGFVNWLISAWNAIL